MLKFALMGACRIGKMHAEIIHAHPDASLKYIFDVNSEFAKQISNKTGCKVASSAEEAINSPEVAAVLIASSLIPSER